MENKLLNKIQKAYNKRSKQLNKNFTKNSDIGLLLFIEHLKYLRDLLVIAEKELGDGPDKKEEKAILEAKISSLTIAILEFEVYRASEPAKKPFHWNSFWEFVKLNAEEWMVLK